MRKAKRIKELEKRVTELEKQIKARSQIKSTSIHLKIPDGCTYDAIEKKIHKRIIDTSTIRNNTHIPKK